MLFQVWLFPIQHDFDKHVVTERHLTMGGERTVETYICLTGKVYR